MLPPISPPPSRSPRIKITSHRDQNQPEGVPAYSFWNQVKVTGETTQYQASPPNIDVPLSEARNGFTRIKNQLERILGDSSGALKYLDIAVTILNSFGSAFKIPADADDTGCSMTVGMKLLHAQHAFPTSSEVWQRANNDREYRVFSLFQKYSYRPFASDNYQASSIDPRTFLWIRKFLYSLPEERRGQDFALITTWLQSIGEVEKQQFYRKMPFNVNNVDVSVTANALYGITNTLLEKADALDFFDTTMQSMYTDNVDLLVFVIQNRIVIDYSSLALLYYPPKFAFFWFVARLVHLLEERVSEQSPGFLQDAKAKLTTAMQDYATKDIMGLARGHDTFIFWEDFLGQGDSWHADPSLIPEDRVFSTSMALNALLGMDCGAVHPWACGGGGGGGG